MLKHMILLCLCSFFVSCSNAGGGLTADELAQAQGIMWFDMVIVGGDPEKTLGLVVVDSKGESKSGGASGWKNGEKVKVFLWREGDKYKWSIFGKFCAAHGDTDYVQHGVDRTLVKDGRTIEVGLVFFKVGHDSVSLDEEIKEGEHGFKFDWY